MDANTNTSNDSPSDDFTEPFCKDFFANLQNAVELLPNSERAKLYRPCGQKCASLFALKEQQRQFAECNGDLDMMYQKYGKSEYFFAEIIEPGRLYEIGFPRCFCPIITSGYNSPAGHCECSRQSIIYVLETLLPQKKIRVNTIHTLLQGANECRFQVTVQS